MRVIKRKKLKKSKVLKVLKRNFVSKRRYILPTYLYLIKLIPKCYIVYI